VASPEREELTLRFGFECFADLLDISDPLPILGGDKVRSYVARRRDGLRFVWEDVPSSAQEQPSIKGVDLAPRQRNALIWLGEPAFPDNFVTAAMLHELAALGLVNYDSATGNVKYTVAGKIAHQELVGHCPTRNI
jgi:hypothetical protein